MKLRYKRKSIANDGAYSVCGIDGCVSRMMRTPLTAYAQETT